MLTFSFKTNITKLIWTLALLGLTPVASRAQAGLSEPLRVNEARPLPGSTALLAAPAAKPESVAPVAPDVAARLLADPRSIVLDVRTPAEFAAGHLRGARNVDFRAANFQQQLAGLDPKASYVLYCASGNRSGMAAATMQKKGFKNVTNAGGYTELKKAGAR